MVSHRICRHVYSLLAAAITEHNLTKPHIAHLDAAATVFRWSSHKHTVQSTPAPSEYPLTHTQSAVSDLSCYIVIIYKTWGKKEGLWGSRA